ALILPAFVLSTAITTKMSLPGFFPRQDRLLFWIYLSAAYSAALIASHVVVYLLRWLFKRTSDCFVWEWFLFVVAISINYLIALFGYRDVVQLHPTLRTS